MFPPSSAPLEPRDSGSLLFPPQFPFHGYSAAGAESSSARSGIDIPSTRHFSFMEGSRDSRDSGFGSRQMASSLPIQEDPVSSSSSSSTRRELDIAVSATPFSMCGIPGGFYHDDSRQNIFKRGETPQEVHHLGVIRKTPASFAAAPMSTLFS